MPSLRSSLDLYIHIDERHRSRSYARNARGVSQRARTHTLEFFIHLAREAADLAVVEPVGNDALLGLLHRSMDLRCWSRWPRVFDFGLDGFHLVARCGRKMFRTWLVIPTAVKRACAFISVRVSWRDLVFPSRQLFVLENISSLAPIRTLKSARPHGRSSG